MEQSELSARPGAGQEWGAGGSCASPGSRGDEMAAGGGDPWHSGAPPGVFVKRGFVS